MLLLHPGVLVRRGNRLSAGGGRQAQHGHSSALPQRWPGLPALFAAMVVPEMPPAPAPGQAVSGEEVAQAVEACRERDWLRGT